MKAKIEIEDGEDKTKFVEVELPHYRKDSAHYYAVISEQTCVSVLEPYSALGRINGGIDICSPSVAWDVKNTVECTEREFMEARNKALRLFVYCTPPSDDINPMTTEMWGLAHEEDHQREMGNGAEEAIQE